jgi:DNA-directed RNA polymerase subunit N (RpoN/RPB10)
MIIPVRCFTCNKVMGSKWNKYLDLLNKKNIKDSENILNVNEDIESIDDIINNRDIFEKLNITRYCCKRHLLSHVDILHKL